MCFSFLESKICQLFYKFSYDRDNLKKIMSAYLRLLTNVGYLRQNGLILSEVFLYMERSKNQEPRKKIYHNRAKKIYLPEEV